MVTKLRFFKQDNKWYADVPDHSLEDNEMVLGADVILDSFALGKDEITIVLSDSVISDYLLHFKLAEHDDEGAWYEFNGPLYTSAMSALIDAYGLTENKIWICNVTHDVFGEHPNEIYLMMLER